MRFLTNFTIDLGAQHRLGDVIDLGSEPQDFGNGRPLYLIIQCTTAFTTGSTSEVGFELATDAAAAIATDGSASVHYATPVLDSGDWTAGKMVVIPMPTGDLVPYERYLGILQNTTTAAVTAGAINAFLTFDGAYWKSYPDAVN